MSRNCWEIGDTNEKPTQMLHLHRVATFMQVDGYSLNAQKDKLNKCADYQEKIIAEEYSDEEKSGESVI